MKTSVKLLKDSDPDEFNQTVNELQSVVSFTLIVVNMIPGLWLDFCRKKWNTETRTTGEMVGIASSYIICGILMSVASILKKRPKTVLDVLIKNSLIFQRLTDIQLTRKFVTQLTWRFGAISLRGTFKRYEYF